MDEFAVTHGDGLARIALLPVVDLTSAESLKDAFLDACSGTGDVIVQGESVERIDTPGLQVLLAAALSLKSDNRKFVLASPSPALVEAMADLGLSAELDRWRDE